MPLYELGHPFTRSVSRLKAIFSKTLQKYLATTTKAVEKAFAALQRHLDLVLLRVYVTRWNSMFTMLETYVCMSSEIKRVDAMYDLVPKPAALHWIVALTDILKIFNTVTGRCEGDMTSDEQDAVASRRSLSSALVDGKAGIDMGNFTSQLVYNLSVMSVMALMQLGWTENGTWDSSATVTLRMGIIRVNSCGQDVKTISQALACDNTYDERAEKSGGEEDSRTEATGNGSRIRVEAPGRKLGSSSQIEVDRGEIVMADRGLIANRRSQDKLSDRFYKEFRRSTESPVGRYLANVDYHSSSGCRLHVIQFLKNLWGQEFQLSLQGRVYFTKDELEDILKQVEEMEQGIRRKPANYVQFGRCKPQGTCPGAPARGASGSYAAMATSEVLDAQTTDPEDLRWEGEGGPDYGYQYDEENDEAYGDFVLLDMLKNQLAYRPDRNDLRPEAIIEEAIVDKPGEADPGEEKRLRAILLKP
ncbi:hypothetical protein PHMEG_00012879 [Phytophthora megakarya]|uniref:Uncharacterized protein n=1 Tax=Phytophthora megakarya TaxID=4795 RepID=A0A225W7M3_9STRA|nr:hypothetical protein PHMEG_00012879 [Phytophthora megakarya]